LGGMLDLNLYPQAMRGSFGPRMTEYREQTVASIAEMKALADEQGAQLVIVWLGFRPLLDKQKVAVEAVTAELGIPLYLGYEPLTPNSDVEWGGKFHDPKYQVSRFNKHPNRLGHRLIADVVYEGLTRDGLLQTR